MSSEQFGQYDMTSLLQQAQAMQEQLLEAQQAVAQQLVEGQAGGGAVAIEATASLQFRRVRIDQGALDPDDPEMLEDLVLAALNDVVAKANAASQQALGGLDLGSLGLPGAP